MNRHTMKPISAALIAAILSNTAYAQPTVPSETGAISSRATRASPESSIDRIETAVYTFQSQIDSGAMSLQAGAQGFADQLYQAGITTSDILAYVRLHASPKEFESFEAALQTSMSGLKDTSLEALSEKERAHVLSMAISATRTQGVSWSGCAGATIGVILIVAAVVVGIVALTKSVGEKRIRKKFADRKASRTERYQNELFNMKNEKQNIQNQIADAQTKITYNNSQINYYTGVLAGADLTDAGRAKAQEAQQKIKHHQDQNGILNSRISEMNLKLALYNDPAYLQARIDALTLEYDFDMKQYDVDEANAIALVPENQRLARGMGIGAGVGSAIGTYLAIDGFQSCN
jgi:hypothetical protein